MKVLIHGAINGSNFGDCLFAKLFYKHITKNHPEAEVYFYESKNFGISSFLKKELKYNKEYSKHDLHKFDVLVYMSGGYFGERIKSVKETLKRYFRYLSLGKKFVKLNKSILICGVGAGPLYSTFLINNVRKIMNHSQVITVRDEKSKNFMIDYGVTKPMKVTSDSALTLNKSNVIPLETNKKNKLIDNRKKNVFIHLSDLKEFEKIFTHYITPIINKELTPDKFNIIFSYDSLTLNNKYIENSIWQSITNSNKKYYQYNSVEELISLLNEVDVVITPKLHVGIVSSILNKSVISIPVHAEKTVRFYRQINQRERCIPLEQVSSEKFELILNKYLDEPIIVSQKLVVSARENFKIISEVMDKHFV